MIDEQHPVMPSAELLSKWDSQYFDEGENLDVLLIQVYQAGADTELKACCEWADETGWVGAGSVLRRLRRPKPLSLKKQALHALLHMDQGQHNEHALVIRRALEQLND